MSRQQISRWSGFASIMGGLLWLAIWIAFLNTHGPTDVDRERTLFSLSYYDYSSSW